MGDPLTPPLLLLTKMLSLSSVAIISKQREPVKAVTVSFCSPTSCHYEALSGNMAMSQERGGVAGPLLSNQKGLKLDV